MKKIGILGSGSVAKVLSDGFVKHGYCVAIGARDIDTLLDWKKTNSNLKVGTFSEAAAFGEIIVLAVTGKAAKEVLEKCGNLSGKIIIDPTDPVDGELHINGVLSFFTTLKYSLMEDLQNSFPEVNFVKAFNSIGSPHMVNPDFGGIKPTMFICGNNIKAKEEVTEILDKFGWETEDVGKAESARAIEPLCILWCARGFQNNHWSHAFKLLKK
jgi:predicted dinucleotide-binding enzyme